MPSRRLRAALLTRTASQDDRWRLARALLHLTRSHPPAHWGKGRDEQSSEPPWTKNVQRIPALPQSPSLELQGAPRPATGAALRGHRSEKGPNRRTGQGQSSILPPQQTGDEAHGGARWPSSSPRPRRRRSSRSRRPRDSSRRRRRSSSSARTARTSWSRARRAASPGAARSTTSRAARGARTTVGWRRSPSPRARTTTALAPDSNIRRNVAETFRIAPAPRCAQGKRISTFGYRAGLERGRREPRLDVRVRRAPRGGRVENASSMLAGAISFKRRPPAVERCKSQRRRRSYGRRRLPGTFRRSSRNSKLRQRRRRAGIGEPFL